MRIAVIFLFNLFFLIKCSVAQEDIKDINIGQWRSHLPYKKGSEVALATDIVYCATENAVFSFNKKDNSISRLDKTNLLNDVGISTINYSIQNDLLAVAYNNSNLDIIAGNKVVNISDIKRSSIIGNKAINHIYFNKNLAYLSCGFGIVVVDLAKMEIKDTYYIGADASKINVYMTTIEGDFIYAATEDGVKKAALNSANIANYNNWILQDSVNGLPAGVASIVINHQSIPYVLINDSIFRYDEASWSFFYADPNYFVQNITSDDNTLIVVEIEKDSVGEISNSRIITIDDQVIAEVADSEKLGRPQHAVRDENGTIWVADLFGGLLKVTSNSVQKIQPGGPGTSNVTDIFILNNELWVAPGSRDNSWNYQFNFDGLFSFNYGYWGTYNVYNHPAMDTVFDFISVAVNPVDDHVFAASYGGGLLEFYNGEVVKVYKQNSGLQDMVGDPGSYRTAGLAFDNENNLWIANYGSPEPLVVKTPANNWYAYKPPFTWAENSVSDIVIDDYNQKWVVLAKREGIMVFDHGDDLEDKSDDQFKRMKTGLGAGGLPTINVNCIRKDLDGEIWVGTDLGIAVYYCPGQVFSSEGCDAQQVLVEQDGVAGYLLETEIVNDIAVDGANRKWVGTTNGVWLLSEDGTETINYFNVDNSPLLSNSINAIAVDGVSGEVFIGTDKGIISYKGTATEGELTHGEVYVYPNPVREDYDGVVAIKGLVRNAITKVTDIGGTLIYETTADGGQATWDGFDYDGKKAKTGVYLVFTTDEFGEDRFVTKFLIVN